MLIKYTVKINLPEDDLSIEICWSDFKCFNVIFYVSAFVG